MGSGERRAVDRPKGTACVTGLTDAHPVPCAAGADRAQPASASPPPTHSSPRPVVSGQAARQD